MEWHLYVLDCDGRYYTGIAVDPLRRLAEHRARGTRAARFTRAARSHDLVYAVAIGDRSLALRAEARLKKLARAEKEAVVRHALPRDALLDRLGLPDVNAGTEAPA